MISGDERRSRLGREYSVAPTGIEVAGVIAIRRLRLLTCGCVRSSAGRIR